MNIIRLVFKYRWLLPLLVASARKIQAATDARSFGGEAITREEWDAIFNSKGPLYAVYERLWLKRDW